MNLIRIYVIKFGRVTEKERFFCHRRCKVMHFLFSRRKTKGIHSIGANPFCCAASQALLCHVSYPGCLCVSLLSVFDCSLGRGNTDAVVNDLYFLCKHTENICFLHVKETLFAQDKGNENSVACCRILYHNVILSPKPVSEP